LPSAGLSNLVVCVWVMPGAYPLRGKPVLPSDGLSNAVQYLWARSESIEVEHLSKAPLWGSNTKIMD
jgi:hypothetical protein